MKENLISFCMWGVFKNSLRYVYGLKCLSSCKSDLGALSSEFHSTGSTSRSPQKKEQWEKSERKTKIMETAKLEGERKLKKIVFNLISCYGKLMQTVITII